jgi:hypothetical protein
VRTTAIAQRIRRELPDTKPDPTLEATIRKWFAADDDFNLWFLETTKGKLDDSSLLALVEGYGDDQDAVEHAWESFRDHFDAAGLITALENSMVRLGELKQK